MIGRSGCLPLRQFRRLYPRLQQRLWIFRNHYHLCQVRHLQSLKCLVTRLKLTSLRILQRTKSSSNVLQCQALYRTNGRVRNLRLSQSLEIMMSSFSCCTTRLPLMFLRQFSLETLMLDMLSALGSVAYSRILNCFVIEILSEFNLENLMGYLTLY